MTLQIPLSRGLVATIDDEDYELVSQFKWHANPGCRTYYAVRNVFIAQGKYKAFSMHRVILGIPHGDPTRADHIDGNGLNNRRSNLRRATQQQNNHNRRLNKNNSTGYKGVSRWPNQMARRFLAHIRYDGRSVHLGLFDDPVKAAFAYDAAAVDLFGEFAQVNFPPEPEAIEP